jgi:hypothetical protein
MDYKIYLEEQKLAPTTIKNHIRNLASYSEDYSLQDNETKTIEKLKQYPEGSRRQTMASTLCKWRTYKNLSVEVIREFLKVSIEQTIAQNKKTSQQLDLPPLSHFKKRLNQYYKEGKFKEFAVLYLLLTFQTRNKDLVVLIQHTKSDFNQGNVLYIREKSVVYIRNDYKTFSTYGQKKYIIYSKKFRHAISSLESLLSDKQTHIQVQKITGGYSESDLMKVSVKHADSIGKLTKISKHRGTALDTISGSYDVD